MSKRREISWYEVTYPDGTVRKFTPREFGWIWEGLQELYEHHVVQIEVV